MGMFGGFMSQSVVVPELDGAIYPYVVNDQELDKDGVYLFLDTALKQLVQAMEESK